VESTLDLQKLRSVLESLLFVTKKPLTLEELQALTQTPPAEIEAALTELARIYEDDDAGIRMIKLAHGYILGTSSANAEYVDKLVNSKIETTLSPQSIEALAIIAYKQPITKAELELVRGVYCDGVLETLLAKKLIEEKGRSKNLGRPFLYGTTEEFLRHFGLKDLSELPPLPQNMEQFQTALKEAE